MFLFPIRKKSRQLLLNALAGASIFLFLLAFFMQITSRFTGLEKSIDYVFLAAIALLLISILFRAVFKTSVNAGFIGFEGLDFMLMAKDKQSRINIPDEKIEKIAFKPGHSADDYRPASFLLGLVGLFLGQYDGADSVLMIRSAFGFSQYHVKFENDNQLKLFMDKLKKHPKAEIIP